MSHEQAHGDSKVAAKARSRDDLEPARSDQPPAEALPPQAQLLLSLQPSAGNQAVSGFAQRLRDGSREESGLRKRSASVQRQAPPRNDTGLPDDLKSGIESLSGVSLDDVSVHYDSARPAELNALAYTQGSEIHVAPGQEKHLTHEAWHVVQQSQGRVQATTQLQGGVPVNDDEGLEQEADAMGAKALTTNSGSTSVQRVPVPGGPVVVQRVLGVNNPLVAADVASVAKIDGKLVYILTGHQGDKVVVKFEMPGGAESVAELGARREAIYDLARTALERVPGATVLTAPELAALQQLNPQAVPGKTADLLAKLQGGIAQQAVCLKLERVDVGDHLQEMINQGNVTPSLLTRTVLRQLGKMAFFDLLVSNTDRFHEDGDVNAQNIDFTAGGGEALPLDNLDPFGGGIPTTLTAFGARKNLETRAARGEYAANALSKICEKTGQKVAVKKMTSLLEWFAGGIEDAAALCKAQQTRLERVAFTPPTMDTPPGRVAEGLAVRLRAITL